jgi:hypothetical protein
VTPDRYAVVAHYRWSDAEPERATVIRSRDGWLWHDMCTTDPDSAEEIAEALTYVAEDRAERRLAETEALVAQHNAETPGNPQSMAEWSQ